MLLLIRNISLEIAFDPLLRKKEKPAEFLPNPNPRKQNPFIGITQLGSTIYQWAADHTRPVQGLSGHQNKDSSLCQAFKFKTHDGAFAFPDSSVECFKFHLKTYLSTKAFLAPNCSHSLTIFAFLWFKYLLKCFDCLFVTVKHFYFEKCFINKILRLFWLWRWPTYMSLCLTDC